MRVLYVGGVEGSVLAVAVCVTGHVSVMRAYLHVCLGYMLSFATG